LSVPLETQEGNTDVLRPRREGDPMADRGPRPPTDVVTPPWRLLVQMNGENRTSLGLPVKPEMLVGRTDSEGRAQPDLDLGPYDGLRNGVSRRHARITYEDGALYIQDMESTNGTRINGYELAPGRVYRLRDGDELEFGRIRVVIRFVRAAR
jgi:pSer/pThr/pTyr-binding forkhead associated (FHA) protein